MSTQLRRIALAADLGPATRHLLVHGLGLALAADAHLDVLHAPRPGEPGRWDVTPVVGDLLASWRHATDAAAVRQVTASGDDPLDALIHTAETLGPDLLLLGSERRHGVDRLLRASTAERLARAFSIGALFVGDDMPGLIDPLTGSVVLERVLVPVGPDVDPRDAIDAALAFLSALGATAELCLLHVGSSPIPKVIAPNGVAVRGAQRSGPIVPGILAEAHDADLIVMITRGHDSLADGIIGSRTERVMRDAPCPLLAVPLGY